MRSKDLNLTRLSTDSSVKNVMPMFMQKLNTVVSAIDAAMGSIITVNG